MPTCPYCKQQFVARKAGTSPRDEADGFLLLAWLIRKPAGMHSNELRENSGLSLHRTANALARLRSAQLVETNETCQWRYRAEALKRFPSLMDEALAALEHATNLNDERRTRLNGELERLRALGLSEGAA